MLTNSIATFKDGTVTVSGSRAGVEGDHDTVPASSTDDTHQEHSRVLPSHGADRGGFRKVQHGDYRGRVHQTRIGAEHLADQCDHDTAGDNSPGDGGNTRELHADCTYEAGEHRRGGESVQYLAGVWERTPWSHATERQCTCQVSGDRVTPRTHTNCTNEISAMFKAVTAPVKVNDIPPSRWRLNGRWYCAFPQFRDCAEPRQIPMKPIAKDDVKVMNLGLGRSIYSPAQLEEFARLQESEARFLGQERGKSQQRTSRRRVGLRSYRLGHREPHRCHGVPLGANVPRDWSNFGGGPVGTVPGGHPEDDT